jgi:phage baseplate assembly protein W
MDEMLNAQQVYAYSKRNDDPAPKLKFLGCPYPIVKHPLGFLRTQSGLNQVKSDLLCLLLTNPGERVMIPNFGTPLKKMFFQPSDKFSVDEIREIISTSIKTWEPRINVTAIDVRLGQDLTSDDINLSSIRSEQGSIVFIRIMFSEFDQLQEIQELKLALPLGGGL